MMTLDPIDSGLLRKWHIKEYFMSLVDENFSESKVDVEIMIEIVCGTIFTKKVQ